MTYDFHKCALRHRFVLAVADRVNQLLQAHLLLAQVLSCLHAIRALTDVSFANARRDQLRMQYDIPRAKLESETGY